MKKLFAFFALAAMLMFGAASAVVAQDENIDAPETELIDVDTDAEEALEGDEYDIEEAIEETQEEVSVHKQIKIKFIEGGPEFMGVILLTLILGLALAIERIIYLSLATTNTGKFLKKVEEAVEKGGVEEAKELCRNTRGPVASIFYQGLDRANEGIDVVEKSVVSYGSVQMGQLESGLTWITLFIAIAPMLGFMGTVIGMIEAFDAIQVAGDISPTLVAAGIKVALITTVFGLIVAIILQVFYNYLAAKVDKLVNTMEDASITLIDILMKYNLKK